MVVRETPEDVKVLLDISLLVSNSFLRPGRLTA
jgi:hypothetical protein